MLVTDIISAKRDGDTLSDEQIQFIVDGLADESIPAEQVSALAMAVVFNSMTFDEASTLTLAMAGWAIRVARLTKRKRSPDTTRHPTSPHSARSSRTSVVQLSGRRPISRPLTGGFMRSAMLRLRSSPCR